jgi:hypothetical protein
VTKQLDPDLNTLQAIASYVGARETHEAKETGTEDTEAGSPTGGWGPPLGAGVPHWGLGSPTGATQRREARRTNRRGRGEDAEDAERTRREDGWRRAGVASGPVR